MNQNVFIQQKDDKKICDLEEHYELLIIEFNSMSIKKMIAKQNDDDFIKHENDCLIQTNENSIIKTSHTDQIVISKSEDEMSLQTNCEKDDLIKANFEKNAMSVIFEDKISSYVSMNSMNRNFD
jgi:hypothetical protein